MKAKNFILIVCAILALASIILNGFLIRPQWTDLLNPREIEFYYLISLFMVMISSAYLWYDAFWIPDPGIKIIRLFAIWISNATYIFQTTLALVLLFDIK